MDFPAIDQFMKQTGLATEPAFDYLHFLTENIPLSENRRILGLYYPEGDTEKDGFGYLPPSTIILPLDSSESTLLHELGHRYGHFYYDNLSEEFAENYRRTQEKKLQPVYAGRLARFKEVPMERIRSRNLVCADCPEQARGEGKLCAFCELGGSPVALAGVIINAPVKVTGFPAAASSSSFLFKATITCVHPDNNVNYSPAANEVKAELWRNHWAILPDEKLVEAVAPAGGVVTLLTVNVTELSLFYIRAIHIATGNRTDVQITCNPDGTWHFGW